MKIMWSSAALLIIVLSAVSASASMTVHFGPDYSRVTYGGEFTITVRAGSDPVGIYQPGQSFQTFCLEYNEHINIPNDYLVGATSGTAVGGGVGAVNGSDPISSETAYLFTKFQEGTLMTSADAAYTKANQDSLQRAIWYFEQEITTNDYGYLHDAQAQAWVAQAANAVSSGAWQGTGSVGVMNMYYLDGRPAQDQLVIVPAPGALLLGAIGTVLVGYLRARKMF